MTKLQNLFVALVNKDIFQCNLCWNIVSTFLCMQTCRMFADVCSVQVRIQDLVKGGPASETDSCWRSKVELCKQSEQSAPGVQGPLKGPGVCSFCWNFTERQILWSLCSVDFHTFTLQLPIQTLHSVAPELQVFVSSLKISAKRAHPWKLLDFFMLKYVSSHILQQTLFLSFLTSISTSKVDKNRTLDCTSINLRHSYILYLFF